MKRFLFILMVLSFVTGLDITASGQYMYNPVHIKKNVSIGVTSNAAPIANVKAIIGDDTCATCGFVAGRAVDTGSVTGTKKKGQMLYFLVPETYGIWTGTKWRLLENTYSNIKHKVLTGTASNACDTIRFTHGITGVPTVYSMIGATSRAKPINYYTADSTYIVVHLRDTPTNGSVTYNMLYR